MATAPRKGFNRARSLGSSTDYQGLSEYTIASGYATALGVGDAVKLTTDGSIIVATNSATSLGVFMGCRYIDATNRIQITDYWPASQTSTETVTALVVDNPTATWKVRTAGAISTALTIPGALYPMNLTAPDSTTHRSTMTVNNVAIVTGSLDAHATTDVTSLTNIENGDVFTIKSTVANQLTTVTLITNMTAAQLLAAINVAGNGLIASYTSAGYLTVSATDGGNIVLADSTGTPLADSATFLSTVGTHASIVALSAALVQVVRYPTPQDVTDGVLEVTLVNNKYITNIA